MRKVLLLPFSLVVLACSPLFAGHRVGSVTNIGGIQFSFIPTGQFLMGSPDGQGNQNERPQHPVSVKAFWMGKFLVTQKQYQEIMGINPSWYHSDLLPVDSISWPKAKEFCKRFNAKHGVSVRLPTEAEWEYACRAGTRTVYYWGNEMNGEYCWYSKNSMNEPHPVGMKKPNDWGLYDMLGNLWEWCSDWFDMFYYRRSPPDNPQGPKIGIYKVLRGGSFEYNADIIRCALRDDAYEPSHTINDYGFRVVFSE